MRETMVGIRERFIIGPACRETFLPLSLPAAAPLRQAGVEMAGLSELRGEYEMGRASPSFHLLLFTVEGNAWFLDPDGERALGPGQALHAPAGNPYAYGLAGAAWSILWFHLRPGPPWGRERGGPRVADGSGVARLLPLARGFLAEAHAGGAEAESAGRLYASLLSLLLRREFAPPQVESGRAAGPGLRARFARLWGEVDADLGRPWNVTELARRFRASPVHFGQLTVRHYGQPPMRKVAELRMLRARDLLRNTDLPLKRIAALLGYGDAFAFSAAFKRHVGVPPRQFRLGAEGQPPARGED